MVQPLYACLDRALAAGLGQRALQLGAATGQAQCELAAGGLRVHGITRRSLQRRIQRAQLDHRQLHGPVLPLALHIQQVQRQALAACHGAAAAIGAQLRREADRCLGDGLAGLQFGARRDRAAERRGGEARIDQARVQVADLEIAEPAGIGQVAALPLQCAASPTLVQQQLRDVECAMVVAQLGLQAGQRQQPLVESAAVIVANIGARQPARVAEETEHAGRLVRRDGGRSRGGRCTGHACGGSCAIGLGRIGLQAQRTLQPAARQRGQEGLQVQLLPAGLGARQWLRAPGVHIGLQLQARALGHILHLGGGGRLWLARLRRAAGADVRLYRQWRQFGFHVQQGVKAG